MKRLILLRGVSGSGKSTLAEWLSTLYSGKGKIMTVAADDYLTKYSDGGDMEYSWSPKKCKEAHKLCREQVMKWMESGIETIVVHNTFTTERQMKPYIDMALQFGYTLTSLIVENRHGNDSIHNLPEETRKQQGSNLMDNIKLI